MARHISLAQENLIAEAVREWRDPVNPNKGLTWKDVTDIAKVITNHRYERQTLDRHKAIKAAYLERKAASVGSLAAGKRPKSKALLIAEEKVKDRDKLIAELKAENTELVERFVRWSYNASIATKAPLTEEDLEGK